MNIYRSALHPDYIKKLYKAFNDHRGGARRRGIEFEFEFETWLDVWLASGHLHERGNKRGQYVMARYNDIGPYEASNVHICTTRENCQEGNQIGAAKSAAAKEAQNRPEVKAKQLAAMNRPEVRAKRSAAAAERQIKIKTPAGIFPSRLDAAKHYGVHTTTILNWTKRKSTEFYQVK